MRHVVKLLVAVICITSQAAASQAGAKGAAAGKPVGACSILTRDLVAPLTQNKKVLDLIPPEEESMGGSASACEHGSVRLQLFPGARQNRTPPAKDLQPLSGVGETAYFRSNRDRYAELAVWTATHYFTLQVSVPTGSSAEAIKPNTVALANAIIAKLR